VRRLAGAAVLASCVLMVGCTVSQIAASVNVAAMATDIAAQAVAADSAISAPLRSQLAGYLTAMSEALDTAATDLESGTLTGPEIAAITSALLAAVAPSLPAGTPQAVRIAIVAVVAAVDAVLAVLGTGGVTAKSANGTGGSYQFRTTYQDRTALRAAHAYLRDARAQLAY